MTREERVKDDFRIKLTTLKTRRKWTDADVAKRLGCSLATVRNMRSNPFRAGGQLILMVQDLYEEAERKCRETY